MEEKFLEFVAEIMEVDVSEISMETRYKDGAWDSLMMITLIMELEAEYGVSIPMEKMGGIRTLGDLFDFVR
ncbi:MAG: acyl carrier protein [Lachnospiraceae bacterium]|nr:acyl carrier protein [Lachnospiraceae bacterium]